MQPVLSLKMHLGWRLIIERLKKPSMIIKLDVPANSTLSLTGSATQVMLQEDNLPPETDVVRYIS
jgi:hypothetical protein